MLRPDDDKLKTGYIKLFRSLINWEWFDDVNVCHLFIYCLLRANHNNNIWRGKVVPQGAFVTSLKNLSSVTGLSIQQTRTALFKLNSTGEITSKGTSQNTIITINNYEKFQDINMQNNKQITSNQQTINMQNNKQITTDNKVNNNNNNTCSKNKKIKKDNTLDDKFNKWYEIYPNKKSKINAKKAFEKALNKTTFETLLSGVEKYKKEIEIKNTEKRYIKHPSTWLNQECWEDEYLTEKAYKQEYNPHINPEITYPKDYDKGEYNVYL